VKTGPGGATVQSVGITSPIDPDGSLRTRQQDQTTDPVDLYFVQPLGAPTTLATDALADGANRNITLTDATGFVDGDVVGMVSGDGSGRFLWAVQIGAAVGNVIELQLPIDYAFSAATTVVIRANANMAVDGSTTTQIFQIGPVGDVVDIDITRVNGYIIDDSNMDDSGFGGIVGGLTYGVVLRRVKQNGDTHVYWVARTNGALAMISGGDLTYTDRAGGSGEYGARYRNTWNGPEKHDVVIRLSEGDTLEMLIQDDLSSLLEYYSMGQGQVVIT
jgi:hypothetical protein